MNKKKEIVIGVTGGISAYKACELVRSLARKGYGVTVLMSAEAKHFVGPLTFRTLSGRPVISDMFSEDVAWNPCHVAVAEKADIVVVVPATAHTIAKLAQGQCDDIISCVVMATKAKVIVCPAMNDNMYAHPAMRENMKKIAGFGYTIIEPIKGELACGKVGLGHLAGINTILKAIEKSLK
ncbi:MAG: phosphopantothenoylcysteine decarboxylase [Candidatus Omnitrophica bacterium]|nr:phosphopantothenoylcysteine decarboxylase [Candidatus Omnitrophota bacterium]MBU4477567.1 phosphopantothenoylcysteine decarboxylase [Candidatus Omnitrophota bacterium]MCG2703595.1 phosphopantothenoylcysteine decarboxylase [Candidatus Omnitrophota bacterium]